MASPHDEFLGVVEENAERVHQAVCVPTATHRAGTAHLKYVPPADRKSTPYPCTTERKGDAAPKAELASEPESDSEPEAGE